ncbi:hypothetical protein E2C01_054316 [Portunus trituberculatus]|uniref:Uncharacterized protein n=1 Tax=Portunus trituberculatus TaxID=210409 RepID=A0A5B7GSV4_PORTR|nr:hypothetical protein [Portunus trituberculatus]
MNEDMNVLALHMQQQLRETSTHKKICRIVTTEQRRRRERADREATVTYSPGRARRGAAVQQRGAKRTAEEEYLPRCLLRVRIVTVNTWLWRAGGAMAAVCRRCSGQNSRTKRREAVLCLTEGGKRATPGASIQYSKAGKRGDGHSGVSLVQKHRIHICERKEAG